MITEAKMNNKSPKNIAKSHLIKKYILFFLTIALLVLFVVLFEKRIIELYVIIAADVIIVLLYSLISSKLYDHDILSILADDLDAYKFSEVTSAKGLNARIGVRQNAAYLSGDFQTAINICTSIINEKTSKSIKCMYSALLATSYLEMGDMQKAKDARDAFENYAQKLKTAKRLRKAYGFTTDFIKSFTDERFEECLAMCTEREKLHLANPSKSRLKLTSVYLCYVMTYYKLGDTERCRYYCDKLITEAPNLYRARIAEKYIKVLETQNEELLIPDEIFPDGNIEKMHRR